MKQRIQRKFELWRREPTAVRLRIATLLTAVSGAVLAVLWLFILLPLQLHLSTPTEPGVVSGIRNVIPVASPTATPAPQSESPQANLDPLVGARLDGHLTPSPTPYPQQ